MSTAFFHSDSFALLSCPLVMSDACEAAVEPSQDEISASQAVAVYRRVVDSADGMGDSTQEMFGDKLNALSIDELRRLAAELCVPQRGTIIKKSELIAEIRRRM